MEGEKGIDDVLILTLLGRLDFYFYPGTFVSNFMKLSFIIFMVLQKCRKLESTPNDASRDFMTLKSDAHIVAPVS